MASPTLCFSCHGVLGSRTIEIRIVMGHRGLRVSVFSSIICLLTLRARRRYCLVRGCSLSPTHLHTSQRLTYIMDSRPNVLHFTNNQLHWAFARIYRDKQRKGEWCDADRFHRRLDDWDKYPGCGSRLSGIWEYRQYGHYFTLYTVSCATTAERWLLTHLGPLFPSVNCELDIHLEVHAEIDWLYLIVSIKKNCTWRCGHIRLGDEPVMNQIFQGSSSHRYIFLWHSSYFFISKSSLRRHGSLLFSYVRYVLGSQFGNSYQRPKFASHLHLSRSMYGVNHGRDNVRRLMLVTCLWHQTIARFSTRSIPQNTF